jgi:hypothetical protein
MPLPRHPIPSLGISPRTRSTFILNAPILPPEILVDSKGTPRWLAGITFNQLGCDPLERIEAIVCGDVPDEALKSANPLGDVVSFDTFVIYDGKEASLRCMESERILGDITIRYPSMVSAQLAAELMTGGARPYDPLEPDVNASLATAAAVIAGGPYTPAEAMALLEQAAADTLHGAEATFHVTPRGFSTLTLVDIADGLAAPGYMTAQGHRVIADAGYTGPEPTANDGVVADEWWYASGPTFWAMTEATPLGLPHERLDIARNLDTEILEAFAVVAFDPCSVVAVPVSYDFVGS